MMTTRQDLPPLPDILQEREKAHGDFERTAAVAQELKYVIRRYKSNLSPQQREVMDQIASKMARILSGDPNEPDHWDDIAGYARLGKGDRGAVTRVTAVVTDEHQAILDRVARVAGRAMPPCPDIDGDVWCADRADGKREACMCQGPCVWLNSGEPPGPGFYCKAGENYLR
jgi:hypothetical protein